MPLTAYPGLLAGQGAPFLNLGPLVTTGKVFFVDSVTGRSGNTGDDPLRPVATTQQAISKCRANKGDHVVWLPGHAESVPGAAGIDMNIAGVTFIGMGRGAARPTITFTTATTATLLVEAAACAIHNVVFDLTGVDALAAPLAIQAADFTLTDSRIIVASSAGQATLALLTTAAANRMRLSRNVFEGSSDAGTSAAVRIVGGDRIIIEDNIFYGAYTTTIGAIQGLTTDTTNITVRGNEINNLTAVSAKGYVFTTSSTGYHSRNKVFILTGTAPYTAAGMFSGGDNYYAAAVNTLATAF